MTEFVFDTYAIIEVIKGNPNYASYLDATPIINQFILAELCYCLLKEAGIEKAFEYSDKYGRFVSSIDTSAIKEAAAFRYQHKKQKIAFTDAIGYIQAKKLGIKFLTGDKEFESLPNIEFIK